MTAADLKTTADFFVSSGLAAAGYNYVSTDDGVTTGTKSVKGVDPFEGFPPAAPQLLKHLERPT